MSWCGSRRTTWAGRPCTSDASLLNLHWLEIGEPICAVDASRVNDTFLLRSRDEATHRVSLRASIRQASFALCALIFRVLTGFRLAMTFVDPDDRGEA